MADAINILVHDGEGRPVPAWVRVRFRLPDDSEYVQELDTDDSGRIRLDLPLHAEILCLEAWSRETGFWGFQTCEINGACKLEFTRLPRMAEPAWWLRCMNIDTSNRDRGTGIRIGVIDGDLRPGAGLGHVAMLMPDQNGNWDVREGWGHGEVVCRILADRDAAASYLSVAPGAEVIFVDASSKDGNIDLAAAVSAIIRLAAEGVDLINLSWGHSLADQATEDAIATANDLGVTVVAAAGNDPTEQQPYFPARLDSCIGIGALGCHHWGPARSVPQGYKMLALHEGERVGLVPDVGEVYAWTDGTYGRGLDGLAPGVGILFQRSGKMCYDISGTSFAAPMATGLLAVALSHHNDYFRLPRTKVRTRWVRQMFRNLCFDSQISMKFQGLGVLRAK